MTLRGGRLLLLAVMAHVGLSQPKTRKPPRFEDFPAVAYTGKTAMPVFAETEPGGQPLPDVYRRCIGGDEVIRREFFSHKRPAFAGAWIIEECTCGIGCMYPFMWDARNERVYRGFPVGAFFVGELYSKARGLVYRVNSRLLVIEGYADENGEQGSRSYYEWDGRRFVLLYRVPLRTSR